MQYFQFDQDLKVMQQNPVDKGTVLQWIMKFLDTAKSETFIEDIDREIEGMKGTIENEEIWKLGSRTVAESSMHAGNIKTIQTYIDILEKTKKAVQKEEKEES